MQPNRKRKLTMDVFGDVEEARPEELCAARVSSNLDGLGHQKFKRGMTIHKRLATDPAERLKRRTRQGKNTSQAVFPVSRSARPRSRSPGTSTVSDVNTTSSLDSDVDMESYHPDTHSKYEIHASAGDPALIEEVVFEVPNEGSYLLEAENDVTTRLPYESDHSTDPPVRILRDFLIFDSHSLNFVSLSYFWKINAPCEAFGQAVTDADDEDNNQDLSPFDGIPFRTSTILSYSLDIHQDSIWIQTQYAWYILDTPAETYRPFFLPFYSREMLLRHVLRNILVDYNITSEQFLRELASPLAKDPLLGRCWNKEDLSCCQYALSELTEVITAIPDVDWDNVKDAPLFCLILESHGSLGAMSGTWDEANDERSQVLPPRLVRGPALSRKRKGETQVKSAPTAITPTIHAFVSSFFDDKFTVVGERPSFLNDKKLSRGQPQPDTQVLTDIASYKVGDFVMVNEVDFEDRTGLRFAQILFFDQRNKHFHARWFVHGFETILQELAHGQELFLSIDDNCRDVSTDCLVNKCNVVRISLAEHASQKWPSQDTYFYSSAWDRSHPAGFTEVTNEQAHVPSSRICPSCEAHKASISNFISGIQGVIRSIEYHQHDFIRYESHSADQLTCSIGQVSTFHKAGDGVKLVVYRLGRERDRKGPGYFSEPALFLTSIKETVDAASVLGICQVLHISEYETKDHTWLRRHPNCFYVKSRATSLNSPLTPVSLASFRMCHTCYHLEQERYELEILCEAEKKLCAFDPFAGVGGFGLGLAEGCSMQTSLAVEINPSAAETMRRNFSSDTTVLTADASRILYDLVKGRERRLVRGKVDLIYSGPPCQNDSKLNRHKTDIKRPAFTTLSFVDFLRPAFFVMESVPGFLQWRVSQGSSKEIKAGDLKLVLKILHFLGYNVMGQLMHARSFGVPQTRDRFFIVATLPEWGVFSFPEASHAFRTKDQPGVKSLQLGPLLKIKLSSAPGRALHEVPTVAEALSDLPFFDWESPKKLTREQQEVANARANHIPVVPCQPDKVWGIQDSDFMYETPSANALQQRARRDLVLCPENNYQHFTRHYPLSQVENICDVPLAKRADYRHLDQINREWCLRDPASAKAIGGYLAGAYTRLNPDGYFHTIITYIGPVAKQSTVLHPFCKRILTVRELARAQGFPDDFTFYSDTDNIDDYHKQIGNSVPFGVSAALGRSIQSLVVKKWLQQRKKPGRELLVSQQ